MYLTDKQINIPELFSLSHHIYSGAVVLFSGEVRGINQGKEVEYLEYESCEEMAVPVFDAILEEARQKWQLNHVVCIHRIGQLARMECAVVVITTSTHRADAYAANRFIIDKVKADVPIWKKEVYIDGTHAWGSNCECHHHTTYNNQIKPVNNCL